MPEPTKYVERDIPQISLKDFPNRIDEITSQLCAAAEHVGFFGLTDHGIAASEIDAAFALSESFFRLPAAIKATVPWSPRNAGWEDRSQVRPSNAGGTVADNKESYKVQFSEETMTTTTMMMRGDPSSSSSSPYPSSSPSLSLWVSDEHVPGFRDGCLKFMHRLQAVSEQLMVCFARGLGFDDDDQYFVRLHDPKRPDCQSTLRLLHYYDTPRSGGGGGGGGGSADDDKVYYRAGAHTDWGFLTLLLQRPNQNGLEICPGRESATEFGSDAAWTRVPFSAGSNNNNNNNNNNNSTIVCNIGDLLQSWSDDRFRSTLHRVKAPETIDSDGDDYYGERFSIAFFNHPCRSAVIQGPEKKYPPVTGEQFIANAMETHYTVLKQRQQQAEMEVQASA